MGQLIEGIQEYWTIRSDSYSVQNLQEMNNWKRDAWREKILREAPQKEKLDILDIGTGPGFFAINLALAGHHVTAVDVTEEMLNHARKNAEAYGAQVDFYLHNGDTLFCEDASFDLIVNRNVIWNLERPEQAFKEWMRALRPGGRMVYFDANWYLYLYDQKTAEAKKYYMEEMKESMPEAEQHTEKMPEEKLHMLEDIARSLPMSKVHRPAWDVQMLESLGMKILKVQEDIGEEVLDMRERMEYRANPMFMVCAEKPE